MEDQVVGSIPCEYQGSISKALQSLKTVVLNDQRLLPFFSIEIQQKQTMLLQETRGQTFFAKLGRLLEEAVKGHPKYQVKPKLFAGLGKFASIVAASSPEKLHQSHYYLVQKIDSDLIRTSILVVGRGIKSQKEIDANIKAVFGFSLMIGTVESCNFTENEKRLASVMLSGEELEKISKNTEDKDGPAEIEEEQPIRIQQSRF